MKTATTRRTPPKYRHHKSSGQAMVEFKGRQYYLGKYDSPASREAYNRFVAEHWQPTAPPAKGQRAALGPAYSISKDARGAASRFAAETDDGPVEPVILSKDATLTQFYEDWYRRVVLDGNERAKGTYDRYREALKWWEVLTLDPPLHRIDDRLLVGFAEALRTAEYRRGPGKELRRLSRQTVASHLRAIRSVIVRAGSHAPKGGAVARLLEHVPHVPQIKKAAKRKLPYTLEQARAIAAACAFMEVPVVRDMTTRKYWEALVAMLFYTGLRIGTVLSLRWRHLVEDNGQLYLDVPAELVTKTGKPIRIAVHPQLAAALRIKFHRSRDHLILPKGVNRRRLLELYKRLQHFAGLKGAEISSPHAWRRTHGQILAEQGLLNAELLACKALDHSSTRVTTTSYISVVDQFRLMLPDLWPSGVSEEVQLLLFPLTATRNRTPAIGGTNAN